MKAALEATNHGTQNLRKVSFTAKKDPDSSGVKMNRLFHYSLAMCPVLVVAMALTAKAADVPVFVFAGQSNAVGVNTLSELTPAQQRLSPMFCSTARTRTAIPGVH